MQDIQRLIDTIIIDDANSALASFPDNCIDLIVTSPPYFGCRQYGNETIGRELNPMDYVERFLSFSSVLRRVLSQSGSFYLNIGDIYFGTKGFSRNSGKYKRKTDTHYKEHKICKPNGRELQYKQLLLLPARVAIGMQAQGWILRNDIIWHKPNALPCYSQDRRLPRYEHIYHFVKSSRYYFNYQKAKDVNFHTDILTQTIQPFKDHPASYPLPMIEKLIHTTSRKGEVVLDPFAGSGTTLVAAKNLQRKYIGIEINKSYLDTIQERLRQ